MAEHRTRAQREANEIDLQMFNLARRIERFAQEIARAGEKRPFLGVARDLTANRFYVQSYMHPKDREKLNA
ncbi:hypothetical protein J2X76_003635 [Neorhizobium sp. 2083]|uniref:hypothetical protein n=1 Tax=Neorhizobium sp. 2083 TaxID=2817762 RepID=UPI00285CCA04|nr:hypothetical protein [Neorhizobium sp. 2083]MDR6818458.1 hypothetical protein [Neorhizobium sp. 2083]